MAVCPKGHQSAADDYCDVCGTRIAGAAHTGDAGVTSVASGSAAGPAAPRAAAPAGATTCQVCGDPLVARFCEGCGHDSLAPVDITAAKPAETVEPAPAAPPVEAAPPAAGTGTWQVIVSADRGYFERIRALNGPDAGEVSFPPFFPERRFPLAGQQILIGRRSRSRGVYPDIDLAGPPEDSAVSHTHALLIPQPDRTWAVVDLRSTNCTYLNGSAEPIAPETPLTLRDGDHLNVGAWTRLTLRST